ncbi:MAG: pyruvate synthase subunit PorD [Proteobacteria bacterium]|nr:pyruvate synthase subunit PorD [Pseudomonadota bacterium]
MPKQVPNPNWRDLALGGAIIEPGSAKYNRTGDWRSDRPIWNFDKCIKCGICSVFCPEGSITMRRDGIPENDLEYCKGCGICMVECYTGCIAMEEEKV